MSDTTVRQRGARIRAAAAAAPAPATKAQLESQVESLKNKTEVMSSERVALDATLAQQEAQLKDLSGVAANYERVQKENEGLNGTIARLDRLLLQREDEERGVNFPDGDRAKWFRNVAELLRAKNRLVRSIEDLLIDDAKTRGLDVNMGRATVMRMLEMEEVKESSEEINASLETTAPVCEKRTLGPAICGALFAVRKIAKITSLGAMGSGPLTLHAPSGPFDRSELCADERRRIKSLRLDVAELNGEIRVMRIERKGIEEENMILRNLYIDLREDQAETYDQILQLTGRPWKPNPPGALPKGKSFVRTVGAIEQIKGDRDTAEEERRAREEAYAAMNDAEKQEFDRRELEERRRADDVAALARSRKRAPATARAAGAGETGGDGGAKAATGDTGGAGDTGGEEAQGGESRQAEARLIEAQQRIVEMGEELAQQQQDCEDEKRRMLEDAERNDQDHEEDKDRLREQIRRDHERCEREKRVLRERIASMRAEIDRLAIASRLYEQQTAGLGQATARAPHLEGIHLEFERAVNESTALRGQLERLQLRVGLLERTTSAEDMTRYEAIASGVEQMRELMSCDEVRTELNQNRVLLERSLSTQQSLGHAMRGLMNYVLSVRTPGVDGALRPPTAALQAVGRMQSDFQEHERRWAGAEQGATTNAMLRRKLRKTIARAASLRVEEIEDITAENDALRAQLAANNSIVDLQRWRTVNKEIEIIESEMLEAGPHPLASPRDLLRLARLRTERLRMMPSPELRQFAISLQKEAIPAIHDLPDDYFFRQWNDLYDNVRAWCTTYYSFQDHSTLISYDSLVGGVQLLGFYLRDVLLHRDYVPQFLNNPSGTIPTGRADVATAIVFRILVEEIFEPIRFIIGLRFTDATQRWKFKKQYKIAFEVRDMSNNAYQPRFQDKESFLERKRKQDITGYPYPDIDEGGLPPRKRIKSSLQKFNFLRTFEDDEPVGTSRDNDGNSPCMIQDLYYTKLKLSDDIILNTSRAKFMRTIFSLSTDPTNPQFKEMRSNVSNLIIDTLNPLGHTRIPGRPAVPRSFNPDGTVAKAATEAVPEVRDATWRANPRIHKASLWDIIKRAYDLAIMMRCQRTNIHPLMHDLPSMMSFDHRHFTIVNYPENVTPVERASMDAWFARSSPGPVVVGCARKPICEVLPALLRRGDPELGNYSWRDRVVIAKSKVYVGGPDSRESFQLEPQSNFLYSIAEYPFATDPDLTAVPSGDAGGGGGGGIAGGDGGGAAAGGGARAVKTGRGGRRARAWGGSSEEAEG
ncbi:hypothetical protein C7212DRAFT_348110 [Tuber magnatum]|uniref:Uncharacterized protein n=1 Tax=Tuber magnatum TaxID=42249 RepID=A0A317SH17_9PEZI|nr:hypothetical protein C7212DRAFT_348110 [Tuber magnatum]